MRINLRGGHVFVPEELLHGPYVLPTLQKMSGKTMAKHMGGHMLGNVQFLRRRPDGALDGILMHVMTPFDPGARIPRHHRGWKYPKPRPGRGGARRLVGHRVRHLHARRIGLSVRIV